MSLSVEDKLAIQELLSRAAYGLDERVVDMLEDCFAEDAEMSLRIAGGDLVGPFEGREAIMGLMKQSMEEQTDQRRHVTSNSFYESEAADDVRLVSILTLVATENDATQVLSAGLYRDRVRKQDGEWKLTHRHIDLDRPY